MPLRRLAVTTFAAVPHFQTESKEQMTRLLPCREAERLDTLRSLAILDTKPEPHFDAICRLAQSLFSVPIAYIALLDADRQWFKASCGLAIEGTPRDVSFCARTILFEAPFIVPDAAADRRYVNNPFVTGPMGIRFYAGVPLALEPGLQIGTLCLMDIVPRDFHSVQIALLEDLAKVAVAHLRLHEADQFMARWRASTAKARKAYAAATNRGHGKTGTSGDGSALEHRHLGSTPTLRKRRAIGETRPS